MTSDENSQRETESRRILDRIAQEAESGGGSLVGRTARRARAHVSAQDVDPDDWAEYWGSRIGRSLGLIIAVGLIVWLIVFIVTGE